MDNVEIYKNSCTNTILALTRIKIGDSTQTKKQKQENRVEARKKNAIPTKTLMKIMKLSNLALATKILLQVVFVHVIAGKAKMIAVKDLASKAAFKRVTKKRGRGRPKKK